MASRRKNQGINAVIKAAGTGAPPAAPTPADQLSMLPLGERGDVEALPPEGPARKGRPLGARNKRTEEWQDYLLSRYRSPLEVLAQIYSRPTTELAREMGCGKIEALEKQIAAARDLAPYLHQKMPQAIDLKGVPIVPLTINLGVGVSAGALQDGSEENQGSITITGSVVGRDVLDAIEENAAAQRDFSSDPLTGDQRTDAPGGLGERGKTGQADDQAPPDEDLEEARR